MTPTRDFVYALMDLRAEGQSPAKAGAEDSSARGGVADLETLLKGTVKSFMKLVVRPTA